MSAAQFTTLCESAFGKHWRRPASRALHRDPKMMARYGNGEANIPTDVAERLLGIAQIGRAGDVIKRVIVKATTAAKRSPPEYRTSPHQKAHELAIKIVAELRREKLIGPED
jgi:hypothetical protein